MKFGSSTTCSYYVWHVGKIIFAFMFCCAEVAAQCPVPDISTPVSPLPPTLPDSALEILKMQAESIAAAQSENFDGAFTVALVYNGATIYTGGFGQANPATAPGIAPDPYASIFRIGSISKMFTAAMALAARDKGLISLDSTLASLLGSFGDKNVGLDQSTLRALLGHVSGAPREAPCLENNCDFSTPDILANLSSARRVFFPFTRPSYSNLGFALLGHAVTAAIAVDPDQFEIAVQDWVFKVLGMSSSGYNYSEDIMARLANSTANAHNPFDHLGWANPCGGAYSTAADLGRFLEFLTGDPTKQNLLKPDTFREWLASPMFLLPDAKHGYGYGWELQYDTNTSAWWSGKSGGISSWSGQILFLAEYKVGLAVLSSDAGLSAVDIATVIAKALFPEVTQQLLASIPLPVPVPVANSTAKYTGTYQGYSIEAGGEVSIVVTVNSLNSLEGLFSFNGNSFLTQLSYVSDDIFSLQFPPNLPLDCLLLTELAWTNELMVFNDNPSGIPYVYFASMLVGCHFEKNMTGS